MQQGRPAAPRLLEQAEAISIMQASHRMPAVLETTKATQGTSGKSNPVRRSGRSGRRATGCQESTIHETKTKSAGLPTPPAGQLSQAAERGAGTMTMSQHVTCHMHDDSTYRHHDTSPSSTSYVQHPMYRACCVTRSKKAGCLMTGGARIQYFR